MSDSAPVPFFVTWSTPAPSCSEPLNTPAPVVVPRKPIASVAGAVPPPPLFVTVPAPDSAPVVTTPPGPAALRSSVVPCRSVVTFVAVVMEPSVAVGPLRRTVPSLIVVLPV